MSTGHPGEATRTESSYRRVLGNRDFVLLLSAMGTSTLGDMFFDLAMMWYVYTDSSSVMKTAGVLIADRLANVLMGIVGGTLADRWDRKRTMIAIDLARAGVVVLMGFLAWQGLFTPLIAYVGVFVLQVLSRFFAPARISTVPAIVPKADLVTANGLQQSVQQGSMLLGNALGGVVISLVGAVWAIVADALSFVLSALGVSLMAIPPRKQRVAAEASGAWSQFWSDVAAGLRATTRHPVIVNMFIAIMIATVGGSILGPLLPALIAERLHMGAEAFGFAQSLAIGGGLLGGIISGWVSKRMGLGRMLGLGFALSGAVSMGMGLSYSFALTVFLYASIPIWSTMMRVAMVSLLQAKIDPEYLGRAFAFMMAVDGISAPFGFLLGGWLGDAFGPAFGYIVGGVWVLCSALLVFLVPRLRDARV